MILQFFKKIGFLGILGPPYCGIGATIRIGREMLCLPYAGFFLDILKAACLSFDWVPKLIQKSFQTMEHKLVQRCETKALIFQLIGPGFCKNICLLSYFGVSCDGKSLRRKKEEYICVKLEVYSVLLQNKICCNVWVFSCYILSFEIVAA